MDLRIKQSVYELIIYIEGSIQLPTSAPPVQKGRVPRLRSRKKVRKWIFVYIHIEELITWIDGLMDFGHGLTWVATGPPGSDRPGQPPFSRLLGIAFPMHFGMPWASILDHLWNISVLFCTNPSTLEFVQFSIEFRLKFGTLEPLNIWVFLKTLWKNREIANVDFTCISDQILDAFWYHVRTVWHEIRYFFGIAFWLYFWMWFSQLSGQHGPEMLPKMNQEFQKKWELCSPVQFTRSRLHFATILDQFWPPFDNFEKSP